MRTSGSERVIRALCIGIVLGFALVGMVATGLAWGEAIHFSDYVETESGVHNMIVLIREPGYYHVRVWRSLGKWRCKVFIIDQDTEWPYDEGTLNLEPSI